MSYSEEFVLTRHGQDPAPKARELSKYGLEAGTYADGLIAIVSAADRFHCLKYWKHVLTDTSLRNPVLYTGFGDLFLLHSKTGEVFFLDVQHSHLEFVDGELGWVVNELLLEEDIQHSVLRRNELNSLVDSKGSLEYGEVFILEPWEMLGGERSVENYTKGKLETYLSLVGQACQQESI